MSIVRTPLSWWPWGHHYPDWVIQTIVGCPQAPFRTVFLHHQSPVTSIKGAADQQNNLLCVFCISFILNMMRWQRVISFHLSSVPLSSCFEYNFYLKLVILVSHPPSFSAKFIISTVYFFLTASLIQHVYYVKYMCIHMEYTYTVKYLCYSLENGLVVFANPKPPTFTPHHTGC